MGIPVILEAASVSSSLLREPIGSTTADAGSRRRSSAHMSRLVAAVQDLSFARDLEGIAAVVKGYAREFTGADGATFVIREGECCHYLDEDAIAPLWKGRRFPLTACVSGWVMLHREPALIPDIYVDPRIPIDAYRPTFVKSLAMMPIRSQDPLGAVGTYWASPTKPSLEDITILGALADATAVAIQNVKLNQGMAEARERADQLEQANRELDAFASSVAHDLRTPLRTIRSFSEMLLNDKAGGLDSEGIDWLERIGAAGGRMASIIDDLLRLSFVSKAELKLSRTDLSELARRVARDLGGDVALNRCTIAPGLAAAVDPGLIQIVLENLFSNAIKYSSKVARPHIEFGRAEGNGAFFVRDNGVGIDITAYRDKLFKPFQRLHSDPAFKGLGLGLVTTQRIINRHQGRLWIESQPGCGTTAYFSLPPA